MALPVGFDLLVACLGQFPHLPSSVWEVQMRPANLNDPVGECRRSLLPPLGLDSEGEEAEEGRGKRLEVTPYKL